MKNKILRRGRKGLVAPISEKEIATPAYCKICGKEFNIIKFGHTRIYCSSDCYWFAKEQQDPWYIKWDTVRKRCSYKKGGYAIKGIKNFLTKDEVKDMWFRDEAYLMDSPSIDRIHPKLHYTLENCRFIELSENCKQGGLSSYKNHKGIFKQRRTNEQRTGNN